MNRIVARLIICIVFTLGACMNEKDLKEMHRTLQQPSVFQAKYGDSALTIIGASLPDSLWEGVTLKGWTFKNVTFQGTKWNMVKVIDGVFDNCSFYETEFMENTFVNTKFYNPEFRNGTWSKNHFQDGIVKGMQILLYENWSIDFDYNHFEHVEISENQPKNQWDKRNGRWNSCTFKNCKLYNNNFDGQLLDSVVFEGCTLENNTFGLETFRGENVRVQYCKIKGCKTLAVTTDSGGVIENSEFIGKIGAGSYGEMNHVKIDGMGEGPAWIMGGGKDLNIRNVNELTLKNVDGATITSVINPRSFAGFYKSKNIRVSEIKVKSLTIDTIENATFENIEADELWGPIHCTNCTFKNIAIKKIILGSKDRIDLLNCQYENVRRLPGVKIKRLQKDGSIEEDLTMPWELPGAQDPKSIQPVK